MHFLFWRRVLAWLFVYLIASWSLSTILAILLWAYDMFRMEIMENLLFLFSIGIPILLMGIGVVSLLPLSEYTYMRQAGTNPPIARESIRHQRRKRERRELGILVGIVGLTSVLGINPGHIVIFQLVSPLGIPIVAILMVVTLALLITFYRKKLANELEESED